MRVKKFLWLITVVSTGVNIVHYQQQNLLTTTAKTMVVESTAEQVLKQQPRLIDTVDDIQRILPLTIPADIIRKMPVNLTGNSALRRARAK